MLRLKFFPLWLLTTGGLGLSLAIAEEAQPTHPVHLDKYGDSLPVRALARMGTIRLRHGDEITALAFSPNGKLLASGGGCQVDTDIHLWEPKSGKLVRLLVGHTRPIKFLFFSPDGRLLASLSDNHSLRVWDVSSGQPLYCHRSGTWWIESIAVAPDGKSLALGCNDGTIRVVGIRTGKQSGFLHLVDQTIDFVVYSPDGKFLAWADCNDVIHISNSASGKTIHQWNAKSSVHKIVFSPDGKTLATWGNSDIVHLYNTSSARPLGRVNVDSGSAQIRAAVFTPDGHSLITVDDRKVCLWNLATCKELCAARKEGFEDLRCMALTPDGKRLALAGKDHCIRIWETATVRECTTFLEGHVRPVRALGVCLDASWVASADDDGMIRIWSLNSGNQIRKFQADTQVQALALTPRGDVLASVGNHDILRCWDPITGRQQRELISHKGRLVGQFPANYLAFSADGKHLLVHVEHGGLAFLDSHEDKTIRVLRKDFDYVALSPDRNNVACVLKNRVQLWNLAMSRLRYERMADGENPLCITFSPDGRLLVTGELLWDVEEGKLLRRFHEPKNNDYSIYSAAFSPDGKMLVTGTMCGVVQLWEVETGQKRWQFVGHQGIVHAVAFCRSGLAVVSASEDTSLLVWDITGRLLVNPTPRIPLTSKQLENLWTSLGNADASKAFDALCRLAASPSGVPAFVISRIRSTFQYERVEVEKLIVQLDDDQFALRESASRKLEQLGDRVESALRHALHCTSSLEQRRRICSLLERLHTTTPNLDRIHALRAVELLERIGTAEAKQGLQTIAKEAPGIIIRWNADAAFQRLSRKTPHIPISGQGIMTNDNFSKKKDK